MLDCLLLGMLLLAGCLFVAVCLMVCSWFGGWLLFIWFNISWLFPCSLFASLFGLWLMVYISVCVMTLLFYIWFGLRCGFVGCLL